MKQILRRRISLSFSLVFTAFLIAVVIGSSNGVSALGTVYFDSSASGECDLAHPVDIFLPDCGNGDVVRLMTGQTTNVPNTQNVVRAYFQNINMAAFPTGKLQVTIEGGNYCPGSSPGGGTMIDTAQNGHFVLNTSQGGVDINPGIPNGTAVTDFQVNRNHVVYGYKGNINNSSNNCANDHVITIAKSQLVAAAGFTGVYYAEIEIVHRDQYQGPASGRCEIYQNNNNTNCDGIMNSYSIRETSTVASYNFNIAQIGSASGAPNGYGTTIRDQTASGHEGANTTFLARFGADCTTPLVNQIRRISIYDLDFSAAQGQPSLYLRKINNLGQTSWWTGNGADTPALADSRAASGVWSSTKNSWDPPSNGEALDWWSFPTNAGDKYILYMANVDNVLVQQFTTPFDGIYYEQPCNPTTGGVTPQVDSIQPTNTPELEDGGNAVVNTSISNDGGTNPAVTSAKTTLWYDNSQSDSYVSGSGTRSIGTSQKIAANTIVPPGGIQFTDSVSNLDGSYKYLCARIDITAAPGTTASADHDTQCSAIVTSPYLSVFGGDASAGKSASNGDGVSCTQNPDAGFITWNRGVGAGWAGAGAQYAVKALGNIDSFASALNSAAGAPSGLAFANTTAAGTVFGGQFKSTDGVSCDYTSDLGTPTPAPNPYNGGAIDTVSGPVTHYFKGDVYIKNQILYSGNGAWSDISQIPSFRLVTVGGDIYIDHSVSTLSGTYVAEPDSSGTGGTIYTCTDGANQYDTNDLKANCGQQLTIYGSFVAKQIQFLRTNGTVGKANASDNYNSTTSAEKFVYGPEMWLANLKTSGGADYSVTSLPPVL